MPVFELETPQGRFQVDAPDQNAALQALKGIGGQPQPEQPIAPSQPAQKASAGDQPTYSGALNTWLEHAISDIPIVGPAIQKGTDYLATEGLGLLTGQDPAQMRADLNARREQRTEQYPASALSGGLAGAIGATGAAGATAGGARALGVTGENLLGRILASGATNAAVSGADTAVRGGSGEDVINSTVLGGALGGAVPAAGAAIESGVRAVGNRIAPTIDAILTPEQEASRRVGAAITRDKTANPDSVMQPFDERVAQATNVPVINADRGGETTRALARSVSNQSPEARAVIEKTASDRFGSQGQRATDFIKLLTNGNVDDLGYQQAIRDTARYVNKPAYDRAFASPNAQAMWDRDLQQLMSAPAMQRAATQSVTRGANRAAVEGFQPVRSPFVMQDGRVLLKQNADGSIARPTLQFWDQTKRNLDSMIGRAERSGDNTYAGDLKALKASLVKKLDEAVPLYQKARQGAASYFGAEDALDAGRKFVNAKRGIPEATKAFGSFSGPEKAAFRTGFASELIDRIKSVGDRTNVINQVFKSPAAREQMDLVFGPEKAKAVEAYVRVEDLADKLRGALGNSTTARQLVELGIGGGTGFALSGGDWKGGLAGALAAKGGRFAVDRANGRVMQMVAKMLTSNDPKIIESAVKQASKSPAFMRAVEDLGNYLALPVRGAAIEASQ